MSDQLLARARNDLREGELTQNVWGAVRFSLLAKARSKNVRSPSGGTAWTGDDLDDVTQDFLSGSRGVRLPIVAVLSNDVGHFRALLLREAGRFFADRARALPVGRLNRSLKEVLAGIENVVKVGQECWALHAVANRKPWFGALNELEKAAWSVPNEQLDQKPDSPGSSRSAASRKAIRQLALAVLEAAERPVTLTDLRIVLAARLGVSDNPELLGKIIEQSADAGLEEQRAARTAAMDVWSSITDRNDRLLLAYLDGLDASALKILPLSISRSQAYERIKRLSTRLKALIPNDTTGANVLGQMLNIREEWLRFSPDA